MKSTTYMSGEQEDHLAKMKEDFSILVDAKYREGQEVHGGNLFEKTPLALLKEARDEAIDLFVYLQTAIDKMEEYG